MIIKIGGQVLQVLYQWDVNQDIEVSDVETTGNPVFHFVNCHTGTALVVEPTLADSKFTVHVPNELLTRADTIKGYMYYETSEDGRRTKNPFEISVEARPMPDDYIFEDDDRYVTFAEIIAESEELFEKLASSTFRKQDGYIQYVVEGREPVDIVPLSEIKGERGEQGVKGDDGDDYVLTDADKAEIAAEAAELVNVPTKLSQLEDDSTHRTVTDEEKTRWDAGGGGGTADHRELTNRDAANQHPISAIQGLQTALDGKQASGSYATSAQLTSEASRASAAETALGTRIDGLDIPTKVSDLTNDADYATSIEAQGYVSTETTRAQGAENNLQEQIDSIVSSSDVKDVVGTYAELQAYDTSTLGNNDIIKVLDDSTHSNARSYFRWQLPSETWDYIGSEGVGYTKAEADTLLNAKQDTISDLATIRTGAGKGDTAYQKPSSGIPKTDLASAVQTSLGKADSAYQKPSGGIPTSDLADTTEVEEADILAGTLVSIDTTPTSGSSNLITSGAVYTALGDVESLLAAL